MIGAVAMGLLSVGLIQGTVAVNAPSGTEVEANQLDQSRLTLRLTLSNPEDLKVREGDTVAKGQILSDRVRERVRLEAQKRQLQIQIDRLKQPVSGPPSVRPIPEVAALPPASFLREVADVERARLKVQAAERARENQQRKLDLLQSMPSSDLPEATIPHEQTVLQQMQEKVDQAVADVQYAEAQLAKAQSDRQYEEYQHSLELSKRSIALQQAELQRQEQLQAQQKQESDRSFQLAQLMTQMQTLETQLVQLSSIRSPFNGTIRRIKYETQNDQSLMVVLSLVADDGSPGGRTGTPGTSE